MSAPLATLGPMLDRWCIVAIPTIDDFGRGYEPNTFYVMAELFNVTDQMIVKASGSYDSMKAAQRLMEGRV